ncbi:zwei Ig domain protein zig-8-like [Toxorhynchites rutilus septentrionalis]|uniref:zwei Ig domain protein zig-8-like n=1 Tax=Toxorhynchites rutilus septentrionalis TaxID=329112 RepID=UPI00247A725F|nr:zwei Ig domain protein zig-8-like [Toxorhynchites rutilus septentrionalis]XP_055636950.1 zwei Ig domain protein zig-8-like [Toxorhynchites rutilus septentrionalis]XP_055636951.1 zwei Ig domain protein zig-8-like [Toxorhynchites rutilus septentrionalis]XP_055636952.1 zwei Ig domain protein zig-8-like [Toxorhynchites rutilus septentrionalis]XP_055636953.1 zwei Ig domain protein zig-8-like [Toxorhynchites rutilus septentrionalis]XP_055636954.1 zwei Ig domain protein zig-8-like [Toxorhynchites 
MRNVVSAQNCQRNPACNLNGTMQCYFTMNTRLRLIALLINFFVIAVADTLNPDLQMYWENNMMQPYFDNTTKRDITAISGQTSQLHCRVKSLGDRAVSWIRKRDLHILTVGILTYTNDQRFQSLHSDGGDEWTLRITSPQQRDSGVYECQVSTEPKISQAFHLNVVVSKAKILGNAEIFVKSGSDINLTCVALQSPQPPSFIYWYKGGRVINYSQRGGISVLTEQQTRTSRLLISRASPSDSGNYTCSPSNSDSASVVVHVIKGEHPAAMQHGVNNAGSKCASKHMMIVHAFVIALCFQVLVSVLPNR